MAKRRRRLRRVRYVPGRRRARRNPGLLSTQTLLLAGGAVAAYFIWKKMKESKAVAPAAVSTAPTASVKVGDATITAQIPTSGYPAASSYGGIFSSGGGLGSLG